jgi:hypothetical protein
MHQHLKPQLFVHFHERMTNFLLGGFRVGGMRRWCLWINHFVLLLGGIAADGLAHDGRRLEFYADIFKMGGVWNASLSSIRSTSHGPGAYSEDCV